ncbi:cation-translocating P-type ATPase [Brucepastera parasyntrophica]|uniref:cation-translocating P-type ATPase n=1 Tax=Brucepastera parasyntrophica TaxID=2880008 RepID=UPI00210ECA95|nr:cation-translocating P-type ATPase [Brucepastera parasyntrophica]ULQ59522.1 cation-translocating P-type ATPase [Brucepastera parasyntrophica]
MKYYSQSTKDVMNEMKTSWDGLSADEAFQRLQRAGANKLAAAKHKSLFVRFLEQIRDPMIIVLIGAAILSGAFGEIADMVIILIVVVLNAVLGIFQESKAEKAIEALQKMSAPHTRVKRDGAVIEIKSEEVVPGDIVLLEAGDSVPADMRIIEAASLKIEEAALTGESVPAEKTAEALPQSETDIPLGDRLNMAYMGTNVVYGRCEGLVIATGMSTEMGKIAEILADTKVEKTPLQQKLATLSKVLSIAVLAICIFIFFFSVFKNGGFHGGHVFEMLLTAVSLAVAAIPEGLVVVVTVLLSIGVTKMSERNAIIRRLTAVETLGSTQVICSDKTGTITQNKMTVVDNTGDEKLLATAMALCGDVQVDDSGNLLGEPTEMALVEYAVRLHLDKRDMEKDCPRIGEAPFDSIRKMMSTIHSMPDGTVRQYTKGAPDEILARCSGIFVNGKVIPLTPELRDQVASENRNMAGKALRVLAAAWKDYDKKPLELSPEKLERDMIFIGLAGMIDPIRPEVKAAVEKCYNAGMRAVMITGDHRDTAVAIARELGILTDESQAITGSELSLLSDTEFEERIEHISVYARVQPEHKVRIVMTWRKKGKITAMTGDGVNDAPALKSADIGIGMGITGTDVTKNVADMVLADDNFATIVYAVEEGRRIYENIRKAIQFLLSANLSEVISIFVATVAGFRLFAPIHILWINLITDTFPAMALGMENAEPDSMGKPPRNPKETIFADGLGIAVIYQGIIIALLTLGSFFVGVRTSHLTGMTMAFLTLSMCEIFHSINMRSREKSLFVLKGHNKYLLGAMILSFVLTLTVIYVPGLNDLFALTPLSVSHLLIANGLAFMIIPIVELVKLCMRLFSRNKKKQSE